MNITRQTAIGTDVIALTLPVGEILGLRIDNPSGSWLLIQPINEYVPPYILGWTRSFSTAAASIDIRFVNGPAGQISTRVGDPVRYTVDSLPLGISEGVASGNAVAGFIEQFTPVIPVSLVDQTVSFSGTTLTIIPAVANQRVRLLSFSISYGFGLAGGNHDTPIGWALLDTSVSTRFAGGMFGAGVSKESVRLYPAGLDFPVSRGVRVFAQGILSGDSVDIFASYQAI